MLAAIVLAPWYVVTFAHAQSDPLPSWNDGPAKATIVEFVAKVAKQGSPDFVPPAERIATFDNDGTLWAEQPMYFQLLFALDRVKALAPQHPEWKDKEPFASLLKGDVKARARRRRASNAGDRHGDARRHDHRGVRANRQGLARHREASQDQAALHRDGLSADARTARLPARERLQDLHRLRRRHRVHAPVDGRRSMASRPSRSSAAASRPSSRCATASRCSSACRRSTSSTTRPASRSASRSSSAAAPSPRSATPTATSQMLEWTTSGSGPRLGLIVHHDDGEREWAYDRRSPIGKLDQCLDEAPKRGWTVVSMKHDWKTIFPWQRP